MVFADSCLVKNGGCDVNADCSHDPKTNAVKCSCKIGYSNVGDANNVICNGDFSIFTIARDVSKKYIIRCFLDSCLVNNGGCDASALCSHDPKTNACQCTCKNGYTNTGSATNVVCTGIL